MICRAEPWEPFGKRLFAAALESDVLLIVRAQSFLLVIPATMAGER
jgi:hypothetical protein